MAAFIVTTTGDTGPGSLRQAILDANGAAGADTIAFAIPGEAGAVHTIRPLSALPAVAGPTMLDATTQPGYAGSPLIELDGSAAGPDSDGITVLTRPTTVRGLAINRFSRHGVVVRQTDDSAYWPQRNPLSLIDSCRIGTDPAGNGALGNGGAGVLINGPGIEVGGGASAGRLNVISGNHLAGVWVAGGDSRTSPPEPQVVIGGNRIGTNAAGDAPLGNGTEGVLVESALRVHVTAYRRPGSGGNPNVISGNGASGVRIAGAAGPTSGTVQFLVFNNFIGTDATGTRAIANGGSPAAAAHDGITFTGSGSIDVEGNTVSGNVGVGVSLLGDSRGEMYATLAGNRIGTDAAGKAALGNAGHGVLASSVHQLDAINNMVSGNGGSGFFLAGIAPAGRYGEPGSATLAGNKIGTDGTGAVAIGNAGNGIELRDSANVTIGGPNRFGGPEPFFLSNLIPPGTFGNLISGNGGDGVLVAHCGRPGQACNIQLQRNSIGTNLLRSSPIANGGSGVRLAGTVGATIGGTLIVMASSPLRADVGNTIAGNRGDGVTVCDLDGIRSADNRIARNEVGLPPRTNGTQMGNGGWGVSIVNSSANTVGGPPPLDNANTIGWNGRGGVAVRAEGMPAEQNAVAFNAILRNGGLGIDLGGDGVTPNDALDGDAGPNGLQNFPTITAVEFGGGKATVQLALHSLPGRTFRLDLFDSIVADPGGYGEGERFVAAFNVVTNASGDATADLGGLTVGALDWLTATASLGGNTSEFSRAVNVARARPVYRPVSRPAPREAVAVATELVAGSEGIEPVLIGDARPSRNVDLRHIVKPFTM